MLTAQFATNFRNFTNLELNEGMFKLKVTIPLELLAT